MPEDVLDQSVFVICCGLFIIPHGSAFPDSSYQENWLLHTARFDNDQIAINRWLFHGLQLSWNNAGKFNRSDRENAIDAYLNAPGLLVGVFGTAHAAGGRIEDMERKPSHYFWHPNLRRAYSSFKSKAVCHETLRVFLLGSQEGLDVGNRWVDADATSQ